MLRSHLPVNILHKTYKDKDVDPDSFWTTGSGSGSGSGLNSGGFPLEHRTEV